MHRAALTLALLLAACAQPIPIEQRTRLALQGAPPSSTLYLDGQAMGDASSYAEPARIVLVQPGGHHLEIRLGGKVLFTAEVEVNRGELCTVVVAVPR